MGANAQTTVPTFTASQVLTADQMNQSARTGVPVFAGTTERDAAFGGSGEKTLAEGQLCYLESTNVVQYYDGAAWATLGPSTSGVVQVKQATKLDTFSTTSTTFVDVTGLSVSITPTSASNKVLFVVTIGGMGNTGSYVNILQLLRGSTNILTPTGGTDPGAIQLYQGSAGTGDNWCLAQGLTVLDSPATTSATTYKVQARVNNGTLHINRLPSNSNFTAVSTVTVMEVLP
jgi:hypothetical protein